MPTIAVISSAWGWNVAGLILCLVLVAIYAALSGFHPSRTIGWYLAGVVLLAVTVCSPLDLMAREYLFTAYAIEQILIGLVVPNLMVRGWPGKGVRIPIWPAGVIGLVSLTVWFLPRMVNASLAGGMRSAELAILVAGGVVFWMPIYSPQRDQRIPMLPNTLVYLAVATVWCSMVGLFLAFEQPLLISAYVQSADPLHIAESLLVDWSFSRETDQQTAGLLFWIGAAAVLLVEVMFTYYRWYKSAEVRNE